MFKVKVLGDRDSDYDTAESMTDSIHIEVESNGGDSVKFYDGPASDVYAWAENLGFYVEVE